MNNIISGTADIQSILEDLGYVLTPDNNGWRSTRVYDNGDNPTALKIFSDNGNFISFTDGKKGTLEDLISLTLGHKTIDETKEWLDNKDYQFSAPNKEILEPLIKNENKIFPPETIQDFGMVPNYDYFIDRGISAETCKIFKGGLCYRDKMKNRQTLIIYNSKNEIIGFTGRSVLKEFKIKWKHLGIKKNFVWPAYINSKIIQEKQEVILVESPVCAMRLFDSGIKNVICLFGLEISFSIINYLLRINNVKVIISTNNEPDNNNRGNSAALKIEKKLLKYFDRKNIKISLPPDKDFACIKDNKVILDWYSKTYE